MPSFDGDFLDAFTSIDERLVSMHKTLREIADQDSQSTKVKRDDGVTPIPRKKESIDYTVALSPGETKSAVRTMPFSGFADGFVGGWVDGSDLSVGVKLFDNNGGSVYFPPGQAEYAAYNDFTYEFPVSFPIEKDQEIAVEFVNNKNVTIPVNGALNTYKKLPSETMKEIRARLL